MVAHARTRRNARIRDLDRRGNAFGASRGQCVHGDHRIRLDMGDHATQNFRRLHTRHAEHPRRGGAHAAHRHIAGQAIPHVPRHQHAFRRPWAERIRRHASVAQPDDQRRLHVGGQHAAERLRQFRRQRAPRFQRNRHRLFASQRDIGSHRPAQLLRALLVFHLHHRARQAVFAQRAARRFHGQIRPFCPHRFASAVSKP